MPEAVSVVITCYNLQRYIRDAVQSVLAQDYPGEVQIVVVDDCSTDDSRAILATLPGIELVRQRENGGVMAAMIAGLRAARHDVVFFLDGDDLWHPQKLSCCMECFDDKTRFCTHDLWYMDSDGKDLPRCSRVAQVLSAARRADRDALIARGILDHLDYVWLGSAFGVRRSLGDTAGFIAFCEARDYLRSCYQDWPLAVWVALQPGGRMAYADRKLFGYRLHDSNYSGSAQTIEKLRRNLQKSRDTFRLIEEMVVENGGTAAQIRTYRHVRMRYELLLACAQGSRPRLLGVLLRNAAAIRPDRDGLKLLTRVGLALLVGAEGAHRVIERQKADPVAP